MKRILILTASLLLLAVGNLIAQTNYIEHTVKWYENLTSISEKYGVSKDAIMSENGLTSSRLKAKQVLRIPLIEDEFEYIAKDVINYGVFLPFNDDDKSQNNNVDFYFGCLMAVKHLGEEGINIHVNTYDFSGCDLVNTDYTIWNLDQNDVVCGPIKADDIEKTISRLDPTTVVVSPLDRKVDNLLPKYQNLVQAVSSPSNQYAAAIEWGKSLYADARFVMLTYANDPKSREEAIACFKEKKTAFKELECKVSGDIADLAASCSAPHTIVIAAIANEAALNNAIRVVGNIISQSKITFVCCNRVQSYESIPIENIHRARVNIFSQYYVDYSDQRVKDFIKEYRSYYKYEPSKFAFQGYDITYYLLKQVNKNGENWSNVLQKEERGKMLQSSFDFEEIGNGGMKNTAFRRIYYNPNYTINLYD